MVLFRDQCFFLVGHIEEIATDKKLRSVSRDLLFDQTYDFLNREGFIDSDGLDLGGVVPGPALLWRQAR